MDSVHDIARRLIALRQRLKLSQVAFAEKLDIAKNTLNGYERANRPLTIETINRIRKRCGISADWLLYGDVGQPSHDVALDLGPFPKIKPEHKKAMPVVKRRKSS